MNTGISMSVRKAVDADASSWNAFCRQLGAPYGHYYEFQEIVRRWGHLPVFLLAEDSTGRIMGILPLCMVRGLGCRRAYSALSAAGSYGGPLVGEPGAAEVLLAQAERLLRRHGVAWAGIVPYPVQPLVDEVRAALLDACYVSLSAGRDDRHIRHSFQIRLSDFETVWKGSFNEDVRRQTRKAQKRGVVVTPATLDEFCPAFTQIQMEVWRRLGNIAPRERDLRLFLEEMGDRARLYLARVEQTVVAGMFCFHVGRHCFAKGAVSRSDYAGHNPNNIMYTTAVEDACKAGLEVFDLGTTPAPATSGHHHWKSQYGGTAYPLLGYRRVFQQVPFTVDRIAARGLVPLALSLSYGGTLSALQGPVGRALV
jgi:CelD/BcsL family acetyltransferase involved in cellulose biosynthesis